MSLEGGGRVHDTLLVVAMTQYSWCLKMLTADKLVLGIVFIIVMGSK
jgi:hypothetical protein